MHFRSAVEKRIRKRKELSQQLSGKLATAQIYIGNGYCLVHTQLFSACQQVFLKRQDIVEDKELGGDGVALSTSSAALPLLMKTDRKKLR